MHDIIYHLTSFKDKKKRAIHISGLEKNHINPNVVVHISNDYFIMNPSAPHVASLTIARTVQGNGLHF